MNAWTAVLSSGLQNSKAANKELQNEITERRRAEGGIAGARSSQTGYLGVRTGLYYRIDQEGTIVEFKRQRRRPSAIPYRSTGQAGRRDHYSRFLARSYWLGMAHHLTSSEGPIFGKRIEMPAMRADGTEFPVELAYPALTSGAHRCFTAYLRDVTDRKRADEKFRLAVESAPNAMVMVNQNGKIRPGQLPN